MANPSISQTAVCAATPITPVQFENLLKTAVYDGKSHTLNMVVQVPAGQNRQYPQNHLVDWRNATAAGVRMELADGWPVVGIGIRDRANGDVIAGWGLADRQGSRFAQAGDECPRCGRAFLVHEVIDGDGRCQDKNDCIETAAEYKMRPEPYWKVMMGKVKSEEELERERRLGQYRSYRNLERAVRQQGQAERNKVHQTVGVE